MKTLKHLDGQFEVVRRMRDTGQLPDDLYFKCLVSLGYEYLLIGEQEKGLQLVNTPTLEYYQNVQLSQMMEDSAYGQLVVLLGYKLMHMGLVEADVEVATPNMNPGTA